MKLNHILENHNNSRQHQTPQADEVNPAMGMRALSLISGGVMVMRGRRKKKD